MAVGKFAILIDRDAAVVIVVAQRDEDRRDFAQAGEKAKQMRQPLRHVQEIAGDEDPVGAEFADGGDDAIVPWLIPIEMQVAQMHGPLAGQGSMHIGQSGNLVYGESDFPAWNETEDSIEGFAQAVSDEGTGAIGPGRCPSRHPITRSSSIRSEGVTR